jgi:hypothetical protein
MTPKEKTLYEALLQISHAPDCSRFCALIARKALEKMRGAHVDEIITRNEEVIEVYNRTFGK